MKKIFLFCLLIAFVFAFSSCSEAAQNDPKPEEEEVINVDNGSLDKNLSSMKAGDELSFRMGSAGTLNLSGVNLDSLFSVEFEGGNAKGTSRGKSGGNSEISRVDKNGPFILIPQASGEVSFSGSDVGASIDDGIVKLKKIGNDLRVGKNYVEYDVLPTGIDYKAEGYPEYLHPTYQNYIKIDFNTPQWSFLKDKKVVIVQNAFHNSLERGSYGGRSTDRFGLLENGKVIYSNEIEGLYDLSGKDTLNLYTFLRTSKYEGNAEVFRTYLLIPEDVSEEPMDIIGYPHVFKVTPTDPNKRCEIRIDSIPKELFVQVVSNLIQGRPRYTGAGEKKNGSPVGKILWIKDITENNEDPNKMDVVLTYTKGVKEEFIINSYCRDYIEPNTVFGKISVEAGENGWDVHEITLDDSIHNVSLGGENPIFHSLQFTIPKDKSYTLTITSNSRNADILVYTNRRCGSGGINTPITLEAEESGHITLFTKGEEATVSYQLTEN